ncbi:hypothetical protein ACP70R_008001 [Stipagrostis hirtigluma subsp. patula]
MCQLACCVRGAESYGSRSINLGFVSRSSDTKGREPLIALHTTQTTSPLHYSIVQTDELVPSKQERGESGRPGELSMSLAVGALGALTPKLLKLLEDEYVKQTGLKREIQSLSRELPMMHAALEEVSKVPPDQLKKTDKVWAQMVRELSYDMEDAVDAFMVRVAARDPAAATDANTFKKLFKKITRKTAAVMKVKDRRDISHQVKDIKNIAKELGELHKRYEFSGATPAVNTGVDPRVINLYKYEGELVGIEESKDELIRRLNYPEDDKSLKIVSVVGCGGLGKTTLAQLVHDHLKQQSFDCSAFVSVGRNPNITNILREILNKLGKTSSQGVDMASYNAGQLIEELRKSLQDNRYNIVVDDVWESETWESINCALPDNKCGSKVIVTTRKSDVSAKASAVYKLQPLSPDKSKELFYKRTSGRHGDNQLVEKIIGKCDGVPLSIIAIASLLADRPLEEWQKVYDSIIFGQEKDSTRTILLYSYYDLPSYLKPCLLYLSMYEEDCEIEKSSLIWRWIAEGFVQLGKEGGRLFEIGERYFNELLNRSMVQPVENSGDSIIDNCRVHDIVLDLIRDLSAEENFVTILSEKQHGSAETVRGTEVGQHGLERKVRRLSIQWCRAEHIPKGTLGMPEVVRSIYSVYSEIEDIALVSKFEACRVLVIESYRNQDLKHLGKLLHLRYLEINSYEEYGLPKEIENLKSLQTLRLKDNALDEMPAAICELKQLMCLHVSVKTVPADRIGKLECLEELDLEVEEADEFVVELRKLTRLRVLNIGFENKLKETSYKALAESLSNLQEIRELNISSFGKRITTDVTTWEAWELPRRLWRLNMAVSRFLPRTMNPLRFQNLCYLSLDMEIVEEKDLENLAQLPELLYLYLNCDDVHQGYVVRAGEFNKLRKCRAATAFKFQQGAAPRLESLFLQVLMVKESYQSRKPTRDAIPDFDFGLVNLPALKEVIVRVNCRYSWRSEVEEAEAVLRHALKDHRNRPSVQISRKYKDYMLSDDQAKPDKVVHRRFCVRDFTLDLAMEMIMQYHWLEEITLDLDCEGAEFSSLLYVEEDLRRAVAAHRNRPILQINRINLDKLKPEELHAWHVEGDDSQFDITEAWQEYRLPEKMSFVIDCEDARLWQVEKKESQLSHLAAVHRDRPVLLVNRINEDKMVSDDRCNSEVRQQDMRGDAQCSPDNLCVAA